MAEMNESDLVEVENNYSPGYDDEDEYWGHFTWAGTGAIRSELTGKTRDMVLAKVGKSDGVVAVVEDYRDGGYCPSCAFEYVNLWIEVDGEEVWRQTFAYDSPFAEIQKWLTEEEDQ